MGKNIFLLFTLIFLIFTNRVQAQSIISQLEDYIQQARTATYQPAPQAIWQDRQNEAALLNALQGYHADTLPAVRAKAYYLTKKIGLVSNNPATKQNAVNSLMAACLDMDSGNSGLVSSYLTEFSPADFNEAAQEQLRHLIQQSTFHYHRILRLAGYLQLQDQKGTIQEKIASGMLDRQAKWSAYLALARMGDEDALHFCVEKISQYPVNDDVVYELLPELIYIRQPLAMDYLIRILYDEEPACESADPEASDDIVCGYRVMELLAPVIQDFPLALDASGDLIVDDYPTALQQVRDWFQEKGKQYAIIKDTF